MAKTVDSYRFVDRFTRRLIRTWIERENVVEIPWTPLSKPLSDCRVALVSTAAIATRDDRPFDQDGERRDPWWGDPSFRVIPRGATEEDVRLYHLHIDTGFAETDLNCVLPLQRLVELEESGENRRVGRFSLFLHGLHLAPAAAPRTECARHGAAASAGSGRRGVAGSRLTDLLPIRGIGAKRNRSGRDEQFDSIAHRRVHGLGRRAARGRHRISHGPAFRTARRYRGAAWRAPCSSRGARASVSTRRGGSSAVRVARASKPRTLAPERASADSQADQAPALAVHEVPVR